jgi:hypothetical protein
LQNLARMSAGTEEKAKTAIMTLLNDIPNKP